MFIKYKIQDLDLNNLGWMVMTVLGDGYDDKNSKGMVMTFKDGIVMKFKGWL